MQQFLRMSPLAFFLFLSISPPAVSSAALDLKKSNDNILAFVKLRGNLAKKDVVFWWYGTIFAIFPGKTPKAILKFEGYNVAVFLPYQKGAYRMLSREVTYYQDTRTGRILSDWQNPFTKKKNRIIHVQNDPVNHTVGIRRGGRPYMLPWKIVGEDVFLSMDIPLTYPNPLSPKEFPEESADTMYRSSEHFTFYCKWRDLNNPKQQQTPTQISWVRFGPWLPWMKMGKMAGNLLYIGRGAKLTRGIVDLPQTIRDYTKKHLPTFLKAPRKWTRPNETSWTFYKKYIQQKRKKLQK